MFFVMYESEIYTFLWWSCFLFVTCITRTVLSVSALSLPALSALLMLLAEGNWVLSTELRRGRSKLPRAYSGKRILWNGVPVRPKLESLQEQCQILNSITKLPWVIAWAIKCAIFFCDSWTWGCWNPGTPGIQHHILQSESEKAQLTSPWLQRWCRCWSRSSSRCRPPSPSSCFVLWFFVLPQEELESSGQTWTNWQ